MRFENDRLTRSVIDFEFPEVDYQNPEASGQHLSRVSLKRERTEGGVLFQDGKDPLSTGSPSKSPTMMGRNWEGGRRYER